VIHLPNQDQVTGSDRLATERGSGLFRFELILDVDNLKKWAAFIETEAQRGGLWRLLNRYANENVEVDSDLGTVRQKGSLIAFLNQMGLARSEEGVPESVMRLHMVGENLLAFQLAFERFGGVAPEQSDLARTVPGFLELAQPVVSRVLPGDVWLRVDENAEVEPFFVVELKRSGFAYVRVIPDGGVQLVGLTGAELIVLEMDGRQLFPFFDEEQLARINRDTFRRTATGELPVVQGMPTLYDEEGGAEIAFEPVGSGKSLSIQDLSELVANTQRVDTRFYGSRVIKLYPEVYLRVDQEGGAHTGFAMQDGVHICLFALSGPRTPRVLRISETDRVELLKDRPAEWDPSEG
jgi:hypothetical protein